MKTRIILFAIGASSLLLSCSGEREEEISNPNYVNKTDLKLKPLSNSESKTESENIISDSIRFTPPANTADGPGLPPENPPLDGGDPKDVPVPPRR
ncbi:hypothetical protein [Chryseobacterium indologenes]|uniref:Lipoprotein n=1 Tax=Chryseobacterium indologenes TaxID=253 RepID=A0A0N0IW32_CHRID|nr:hypothetical protein [Chryseobacterium indologenes]KPE50994.1 hypothetical protein AOB46_12455 [Chryseobacterium indologenes]